MLLAITASAPSAMAVNMLVDPEFDGIPPLNTLLTVFGPPFITGQWGAENGANCRCRRRCYAADGTNNARRVFSGGRLHADDPGH